MKRPSDNEAKERKEGEHKGRSWIGIIVWGERIRGLERSTNREFDSKQRLCINVEIVFIGGGKHARIGKVGV